MRAFSESAIEAAAKALANNHSTFESFGWHDSPADCHRWAIVYTNNRDSGILDESNAAQISAAMEPFINRGTVRAEHHDHWACGWIDGFAIKVYAGKTGEKITKAFRTYCELRAQLEDYPVLDEEDFSRREYESAIESITQVGGRFRADDAPEDWAEQVFSWLWENNQGELENRDGTGAYPSDDAVKTALNSLGMLDAEYAAEPSGKE